MSQNKTAIALLVVWALTLIWVLFDEGVFADEDYFYVRVGVGASEIKNCDECWLDGGEAGSRLMVGYRHKLFWGLYGDLNFLHHSQLLAGEAVNGEKETSSNHWFYDVEYRW